MYAPDNKSLFELSDENLSTTEAKELRQADFIRKNLLFRLIIHTLLVIVFGGLAKQRCARGNGSCWRGNRCGDCDLKDLFETVSSLSE
jgi:hypothetical protein